MKRIGYVLLQISGYLILVGGIADITMTFYSSTLPEPHIKYLNLDGADISSNLKKLDDAFLRAIGGCLVGIGIGTLAIIYWFLNARPRGAIAALICMITISEGINSLEMFQLHSRYFIFPLLCVIIAWIGAILWLNDSKGKK